jgi:K+-transporting ATPase ATPase C chain
MFFEKFFKQYPGKFPSAVTKQLPAGKSQTVIEPVGSGADVQSIFFDMWRQDHPNIDLVNVPGDMVTTSGSGLDPHITLENAEYQLDRVASKWASAIKRDPAQVRTEVEQLLQTDAFAPLGGLVGEKMINVLQGRLQTKTLRWSIDARSILRERGEPMRVTEVFEALRKMGHTNISPSRELKPL